MNCFYNFVMTLQDIERGKISKLEKVLGVWRRLLLQKKNLYILLTLWFVFCIVLYGVPDTVFQWIIGVNTTAVVGVLRDQLPIVETIPGDALNRFRYVQQHVEMYDGIVSSDYEFNARLRNDVDLVQISVDMEVVIEKFDYYCLSAIHLGYPKNIMHIGGQLYTNSQIIGTDIKIVHSKEESAFYPGYEIIKERFDNIDLLYFDASGSKKTTKLDGINAICAQHCLDSMNGVKFKPNEEL